MSSLSAPLRLFLATLCGLAPFKAGAAEVEFKLPAQPAADALLAFSEQAKIDVLFPFDELRSARSTEVMGRHEPEAALELLLQGTGFTARRTSGGKFVITAIALPTGTIKGRLLGPDGALARGVQVAIPGMRRTAVTDEKGVFSFDSLTPGDYLLVATGRDYQPLQITHARVDADRVLVLAPQTLRAAGEAIRLETVVVEGRSDPAGLRDRGWPPADPQTAAGNLDLARDQDGPLAYTIYTRDQISRSGVVDLNEFLQRELLDSSAETPDPGGTQQNLFSGSSNLNLRGYGTDETVILVNGRRLPDVVTVGADPQNGAPDVSLIPLSLVEKVEVLPVSASALYSGNPVGGVINIVLRSSAAVNTTELTTTYTNALRGFSAPESSVSLLNLQTLLDGALRLRLNVSFTDSAPPTEADLGDHEAHEPPPPPVGGTVFGATPNVTSATLSPLFGPGTSPVTSVAPGADGTGGLAAFAGRDGVRSLDLFSAPGDGLASSPDSLDYPYGEPERRAEYYLSADYDAASWLQVGFDGTYAQTVINPGYTVLTANLDLPSTSPFNPFQQDVMVALSDTAPLLGEGYDQAQLQFASAVLGLVFKPRTDWRLAFDGQYAETLSQYRGVVGADPTLWQQLVDEGIYNPLRDTRTFGPPAQFYDQVLIYQGGRGSFATLGNYDTLDAAVRATNQSLELPTGSGTVNIGGDYRRDHFGNLTDPLLYGDGSSAGTTQWTGRTLQEYSAFSELEAPLLATAWLPSWLKKAETDLAVRYDAGADASERSVNPTAGLKLDLPGGFSLRASVATSNRFPPPSLSEEAAVGSTVTGAGENTVSIFDPVRDQTYNVEASDQLNPVLQPEGAVTRTVGAIFESGSVHRIRASLDFVDTIKHNEEVYLDAQTVMDLEPLLPGRVERAPLAPGDTDSAGLVTSITTGAINIYLRHSENLNASLDYSWTECAGGTLEVYDRAVYFLSYERQVLADTPLVDELSSPDGSAPDLLKFRDNFGAGWTGRDYGFGVDGHFFDSRILPAIEWPSQGGDQIGRFWQFDTYLQSDLGRWLLDKNSRYGLRAQLRVNNVFGWSYPFYANESSGAGVEPYGDWRGRTYSLSLTATF